MLRELGGNRGRYWKEHEERVERRGARGRDGICMTELRRRC